MWTQGCKDLGIQIPFSALFLRHHLQAPLEDLTGESSRVSMDPLVFLPKLASSMGVVSTWASGFAKRTKSLYHSLVCRGSTLDRRFKPLQ